MSRPRAKERSGHRHGAQRLASCGGFTLLESLASSSTFVVVMTAIMSVYHVVLQTETQTGVRTGLQDGLQEGELNFEKEISNATGSLVPNLSSSMSLTIWEPLFDAAGNLTGGADQVTFQASGSELCETVVPGAGSTRSAQVNRVLLRNLPVPYPSPGLFSYFTRAGGDQVSASPDQATVVRTTLVEQATDSEKTTAVQLSEDIRMDNR